MKETIQALRFDLSDGARNRPIFIGYLRADTLNALCDVPSFDVNTGQAAIARNILHPPIKDWQRPIIDGKRQAIADRFSKPGEFMPNPVLLAVHNAGRVSIKRQALNNQMTDIFEVEVVREEGEPPPLWILDGQHRVRGLAESTRASNPVPLVLLHSEIGADYRPEDFARIFAEVTTEAEPLDVLHRDWLQFAFRLGDYSGAGAGAASHHAAMRTAAILCEAQRLEPGGVNNPFFDKVQLNPKVPASPVHGGGFALSASELKQLILKHYYLLPAAAVPALAPDALALQLASAMNALIPGITTPPDKSVFFGPSKVRHKPMEDAFIVGALAALRADPSPNWTALLSTLNFEGTNWNFSWVRTLGGTEGNVSRKVAERVFRDTFGANKLPASVTDYGTYMQGDQAGFTLVASSLTPGGRPAKAGKLTQPFPVSGVRNWSTGGRLHVKLLSQTSNVGRLEVRDVAHPVGKDITTTALSRGVVLKAGETVTWDFRADHYGGVSNSLRLQVSDT